MDTFIHTVDKRATPAVWRESLQKLWIKEEKESQQNGMSKSVTELIDERRLELTQMMTREITNLENAMGHERYKSIMELAEIGKEEFKKSIRVGWKSMDYFKYAYRMVTFMIRGFSSRKLYVESLQLRDDNLVENTSKFQSNWEFLACLSCQPEYRTKHMLDKIFYFIKPLNILYLFPTDMHEEVCRHIIHSKVDHGRVLTHQGQRSQRFYFVFEGKINMIREIELSNGKRVAKSIGWINKNEHMDVSIAEEELPNPNQLVSVGSSQLLYIDLDDFLHLRKVNEKIPRLYLKTLPLFKAYPVEKLLSCAGAVECTFYPAGKLVCQSLQKSTSFFICKTGQCAILRRQYITDIKRTKAYQKASHPDHVGSQKTFFHAFETSANKPTNCGKEKESKSAQNFCRNSTPKKSDDEYKNIEKSVEARESVVTKKVFVQIGVFTPAQVMGLHEQNLTKNEGVTSSLSLVSEGAEVIKIHKQRFFVLATPQTLMEVQSYFKTYTLETEVQQEIDDKESWPYFKNVFVSKFLEEKQRNKALLNPRGNVNFK